MERKCVGSTCRSLLRFHKPELNLSKWPLAQRTQRVQALKALAGWCSGQKLALNNNRKKQIVIFHRSERHILSSSHKRWNSTEAGAFSFKGVRTRPWTFYHGKLLKITATRKVPVSCSHLSPCRRESADLQRLCVVERQTLSEADQIWQRDHWGRRCQVSPQPTPPAASVQRALPPSSQNNDLPSGQRF